jgi:hypothetical protein
MARAKNLLKYWITRADSFLYSKWTRRILLLLTHKFVQITHLILLYLFLAVVMNPARFQLRFEFKVSRGR